jgi:hypothetical protein
VLDFEYDDYYAPAYKGAGITAIALEKDGKWGYVNSSGDEIISFNCDEVFSSYNGEFSDSEESGHPYLFSDDIVAVSINYSFGYYDIDGNCLVRSTEFEQARPVHRGRAWVCTGGLWGVIGFGDEDDEEEVTTTTTTTTTTTAAASTWATTQSSSTAETTASSETTEAYTEPQTDTEPVETQPAETQPPATTTQAYVEPEPTPEPTVPNDQEY